MSKQRDILPQVVASILERSPEAAIFLMGSVSFGYERPESDLDLGVVVPDVTSVEFPDGKVTWQSERDKVVDAAVEGVRLDMVFITPAFLERELVRKPWRGYYFAQLEVLHDPQGIMQSYQSRIAPWFDGHSDIVEIWKEWMAQRKVRAVSGGKQQGELVRKFPDAFALWK